MAKFMTHFSIKGISHNGYKISIHHFCVTICISVFYPFGGGGCMCHSTGYCFHLFDSGKGCENHPSSLEEGKMLPQHDSRTKIVQFFCIMLSLTILIKL